MDNNEPTQSSDPYFYSLNPQTGIAIGKSDQTDPYSGRPLFAYKLPGEATTTDPTRVATTFNPATAQPEPESAVYNPRLPQTASTAIRQSMGATSDQQLDHAMALAVGGANTTANLRLIPATENQGASNDEQSLMEAVMSGKMSLFQAQLQEAREKGLNTPFTGEPTTPAAPSLLTKIASFFKPKNPTAGGAGTYAQSLPPPNIADNIKKGMQMTMGSQAAAVPKATYPGANFDAMGAYAPISSAAKSAVKDPNPNDIGMPSADALGPLSTSMFKTDYIVPAFLGGSNQKSNLVVLPSPVAAQKAAVQSVAQTLYESGKISKDKALILSTNWQDYNTNGIPPASSTGTIDLKTAEAINQKWDDTLSGKITPSIKDVLESIPEAADNLGKNIGLPEWAREAVVGVASGLTAGGIPLHSSADANWFDKVTGLIGQAVGGFLGIYATGGLTDLAGEALGRTVLSKTLGAGAEAGVTAAREAGATVGGASLFDSGMAPAIKAAEGAAPKTILGKIAPQNVFNNLKTVATKDALAKGASNALKFGLYGQAGQTISDFTQPQQDVLKAHLDRLGNDLSLGALTGVIPGTWKGAGMVGLGAFTLNAMAGQSPRQALSGALSMAALHKVGGFAQDTTATQQKMAAVMDTSVTKGAMSVLHTFAGNEADIPKLNMKEAAPAKDAYTPAQIQAWGVAAMQNLEKMRITSEAGDQSLVTDDMKPYVSSDGVLTPEQYATNKTRIAAAVKYLQNRALPENEADTAAYTDLSTFARYIGQKTDPENYATPNSLLPLINAADQEQEGLLNERPVMNNDGNRWVIDNPHLTGEGDPANNGVRGEFRVTGQGASKGLEVNMRDFTTQLQQGKASPYVLIVNRPEMAPIIRDAQRAITPEMEEKGQATIDKNPENMSEVYGFVQTDEGKYSPRLIGRVPTRERIGEPQPDGTVKGNPHAFNNDPLIKKGVYPADNPNFNKDTIATTIRQRGLNGVLGRVSAMTDSGNSGRPYTIVHIGDREWDLSQRAQSRLGAPEELNTVEENLARIAADKGKRDVTPIIKKTVQQLSEQGSNAPKLIQSDKQRFVGSNEPRSDALLEMTTKAHDIAAEAKSPEEVKQRYHDEMGVNLTTEEAAQLEATRQELTGGDVLRTVDRAVKQGRATPETIGSYKTYVKPLLGTRTYANSASGTLFEHMPLLSRVEAPKEVSGADLLYEDPILNAKGEPSGSPQFNESKTGLDMVGFGSGNDLDNTPLDMHVDKMIQFIHEAPVSDAEKKQLAEYADTLLSKDELDARGISTGKSNENYQKGIRGIGDWAEYMQKQRDRLTTEFGSEPKISYKTAKAPSADEKTRIPDAIKKDVQPFFEAIQRGKQDTPTTYKRGYDQTFDTLARATWGDNYQNNEGLMKILTDKDQYGKQVWYGERTTAGGRPRAPLMATEDPVTGKQIGQPVSVVESAGRGERQKMSQAMTKRRAETTEASDTGTELGESDKKKIAAYESAGHGMGVTDPTQNPEENVQDLTPYEAERRLGLLDEERNGTDPVLSPIRGSEDALSEFFGLVGAYNKGIDVGAIEGKRVGLGNAKELTGHVKNAIGAERALLDKITSLQGEIGKYERYNEELGKVGGPKATAITQPIIDKNAESIAARKAHIEKLQAQVKGPSEPDGQGGPGFDPTQPIQGGAMDTGITAPQVIQPVAPASGPASFSSLSQLSVPAPAPQLSSSAPQITPPAPITPPTDSTTGLHKLDLGTGIGTINTFNKQQNDFNTKVSQAPAPTVAASTPSPFSGMFNALKGYASKAEGYLSGAATYTRKAGADTQAVIDGIDTSAYATDPNHAAALKKIIANLSGIDTTQQMDAYIQKIAPKSPISASMIQAAAAKWGVPSQLILATVQQDSSLGTKGKATRTKNAGNVGNDDSGNERAYASWQAGIDAVGQWLANHKVVASVTPNAKVTDENSYTTISASTKRLAAQVAAANK